MADEYRDYAEGGEGGDELVVGDDQHVDESLLKLPENVVLAGKVSTGEEGEEVLFKERGKLYVNNGEWSERATGDVKLLLNPSKGKVRLLVRQDKMGYLRANHNVPDIDLKTAFGDSRAWVWATLDFSMEEAGKKETFAVRFKTEEIANEFNLAWEKGRAINLGKSSAITDSQPAAAAPKPAAAVKKVEDKSGPIPSVEDLSQIYGTDSDASASLIRYGALSEAFRAQYGQEPDFFVRAPGRVNLIGEHVDYHGYSVLPMALQTEDVVIACGFPAAGSAKNGKVCVSNVNSKYEAGELPADPKVEVNRDQHKWYNYVHCGYKGAFDLAVSKGILSSTDASAQQKGLLMTVDGRVPPGAGVSSSSALVVASLLACARAHGWSNRLTRADLGEGARVCELHIGTMSGGMDQAISAMGNIGTASRVDFEPLKSTPVKLPEDAKFVVTNTLEVSAKAEEAERRYNLRVTEGKLAAKIVAKFSNLSNWSDIATFRELQESLNLSTPGDLLPLIQQYIPDGALSQENVQQLLGVEPSSLFDKDPKKAGALKVLATFSKSDKVFELKKRARHVCSEAERVFQFQKVAEDSSMPKDEQLKALGRLMTQSQDSCRDDYECSSKGLDELVALAMKSGAVGSRLTGAGWGGCTVSLVPADKLDAFLSAMKKYDAFVGKDKATIEQAVFASAPGSGAAIYTPPTTFEI